MVTQIMRNKCIICCENQTHFPHLHSCDIVFYGSVTKYRLNLSFYGFCFSFKTEVFIVPRHQAVKVKFENLQNLGRTVRVPIV